MTVRQQALALIMTCNTVLKSRLAQSVPDPRITGLAIGILEAAKVETPNNKLLASIEIEHSTWPVILSAMHAVNQALQ
jgi:hypothetical protein